MGSLSEKTFWKWGSLGESKLWIIKRGSFSDRRFENGDQCGRTYPSRIFRECPPPPRPTRRSLGSNILMSGDQNKKKKKINKDTLLICDLTPPNEASNPYSVKIIFMKNFTHNIFSLCLSCRYLSKSAWQADRDEGRPQSSYRYSRFGNKAITVHKEGKVVTKKDTETTQSVLCSVMWSVMWLTHSL